MVAVFAVGCGSASPEEPSGTLASNRDGLYVHGPAVWLTNEIPVCWETAGNDTEKGWVRDAIRNSWEAEGNVDFTGWGLCNAGSTGVRIRTADVNPETANLGRLIEFTPNGMTLNFWFQFWELGTQPFLSCTFGVNRESCIRKTAIHEFGHALSFSHEQNRSDTPSSCTKPPQGPNGTVTVGDWDAHSVMNYCAMDWIGGGNLSGTDIEGLTRFYGTRRPVAAVSRLANSIDTFVRLQSGGLYSNSYWGGWSGTGFISSITGAPSAAKGGANPLDVFVRGNDQKLWRYSYNGGWGWPALVHSQPIVGNPVAVSYGSNRVAVFYRRADRVLYVSTWLAAQSTWQEVNLGGTIVGTPAAISWSDNNVDVFARGTDGTLKTASLHAGVWSPLSSLGTEKFLGDPAVASWGPGRLDVFVRGTNRTLYTKSWDGSQWSGYSQLGPQEFLGDPAAVSWGFNRIDVFVRGTDSRLWTKSRDGSPWPNNYTPIGTSTFLASPTVVSWGANRLDVFVRGNDSGLWTISWNGSLWPNNYTPLGNTFL